MSLFTALFIVVFSGVYLPGDPMIDSGLFKLPRSGGFNGADMESIYLKAGRIKKRGQRWVYAVPVTTGKDDHCCGEKDAESDLMKSDRHNILLDMGGCFNAVDVKASRQCKRRGEGIPEPPVSLRGDVARAYFYMSYLYKIPIPEEQENLLREWHFNDPPDSWEVERNSLIEDIQGNRNPFIDYPELVEKVRDF